METWNHSWFLFLNAGADAPEWAMASSYIIAKRLIYLIPLLLAGLWLWGDQRQRQVALQALVTTAVALACNQAIGMLMPTARPFELGLGVTLLDHAPTPSFPSNHLTIFCCLGLCLWRLRRWLGLSVLAVGLVVAWSRIYVGVHFPLDMVGAIAVAAIVTALIWPVWKGCGLQITRILEHPYRWLFAYPIRRGWVKA